MGSVIINSLHDHCRVQGEKKIWKSVNICRSYGQLSRGSFFMKHGVVLWVDFKVPLTVRQKSLSNEAASSGVTSRCLYGHFTSTTPRPHSEHTTASGCRCTQVNIHFVNKQLRPKNRDILMLRTVFIMVFIKCNGFMFYPPVYGFIWGQVSRR